MGILDEAIREHLELKRQHGAPDSEVQQLEDEAFGQAERPGGEASAEAEAPTQFMEQPPALEGDEASRREPTIADLQEPPPPPLPEEPAAEAEPAVEEAPVEEEQPAMEHEIVAEPPEAAEAADEPEATEEPQAEIAPSGPSTEEREAIAEQPTEMYDLEEELGSPPAPSDEEIVEEEIAEPRLAPTDPLAGLEESEEAEARVQGPAPDDDEGYEDEDDAFWNEQRLSDELDQALEAPPREPEDEPEDDDEPRHGEEPDHEDDEPVVEDDEPEPLAEAEPESESETASADEDVLEETPDFLEESPEDDQLWFEQKPPKDFDFDD